ncbi:MAG: AAA family ATPase [Bacteroidetes bacterium]|nr:AAA family ATPase [Bacteroidota bacterium]
MTAGELLAQWEEQFRSSDWFVTRDGKTRFNYFKARTLYFGVSSRGEASKGFQKFYLDYSARPKADNTVIVSEGISIFHQAGIDLVPYFDTLTRDPAFIHHCNHIFRAFANPRNQYEFKVSDPFSIVRDDITAIAAITSGERQPPADPAEKGQFNRYITIPEGYLNDPFISELFNKLEHTGGNFFITGKAGTGKSTFLHFLAQNSRKNIVIAAYTGIAAINVGGTTINSLFMLPFRPLLPRDQEITRFHKYNPRRAIIANMDMLVIDEVSMVRADILEAIDHSLRLNGGDPFKPFGGKQVVLIGDVFQLPPVVKTDDPTEWQIFEEVYKTPYFFSAPSFQMTRFEFVEFTRIHRQSDEDFKNILNKIRIGEADNEDLEPVNKRVYPNYEPRDQDFVLTLVTTNKLAGDINERKLNAIQQPEFTYKANISGDFSKDKFPTDETLKLKVGAQIIFIRNDTTSEKGAKDNKRRWVNGTIAKIHALSEDEIEVIFEDSSLSKITRETWNNNVYKWNRLERKIVTETVGTFEQFPIKLSWAITIHKSQGLTFDKMVLNMGAGAFAHGQTYVALSRARSLKGLALKRPITTRDIIIDDRVQDFYRKHFTFNDEYRESQEILEFILEHSDFFLDLLVAHYPFSEEQSERYQILLASRQKMLRVPSDKKEYGKLSFGEIKELMLRRDIIWNESFWTHNFAYFFNDQIVATIMEYLLELDKVVRWQEGDDEDAEE